jgi:hypothetical protein
MHPLKASLLVLFLAFLFVTGSNTFAPLLNSRLFEFEKIQLNTTELQYLNKHTATLLSFGSFNTASSNNATCKNFPTDISWPSPSIWDDFNSTIGGALIHTIPIGAVCFSGQEYNADTCNYIVSDWNNSTLQ